MKNNLIFCLILMAALFPQWSTPINLIATASWLWLPEIKFGLNLFRKLALLRFDE